MTGDLATVFVEDFEKGMDRFREERTIDLSQFLREMALYFAEFDVEPGNLYLELLGILGGIRKRATFATTNYDLLIERAISRVGLLVDYAGQSKGNVPVLKIHGSCNFLPDLGGASIHNVSLIATNEGSHVESPIRVARSTDEICLFCAQEDVLAPAMALYVPNKQNLFGQKFVLGQQEAFRRSVFAASRIYVIGLRVHQVDQHIWGTLARASAPIYYVGGEAEEFENWSDSVLRRKSFPIARRFEHAMPTIARHHGRVWR